MTPTPAPAASKCLAFIGLGQMGVPMARNLLRAGHTLRGFDLNAATAQAFSEFPGFTMCASPAEAVKGTQALILMLPDSRIIDALLWSEPEQLAGKLVPGQTVIDMSSSDPVCSRDNAAKLKAMGLHFVDAPVSGGVRRAVDGSLSIMLGGEKAGVDALMPVFEAMGKTLVHVGSAGAGHAVKALNNYVSASGLLAVCEALVAAQKFGIDPHLVNKVFNASTGKNNTTDVKVENFMLSETFNSGFAMALMRKDLNTAHSFIERMGTPSNFASQCLDVWSQADAGLGKGADHTAMYKFVKEKF